MADPMTQSSQISSSQGLNDGHSASSKDSKFSDSFFSSPVSLIQSPQDKRVVLGSDKPSENLASSLRFSSQSSSFSPVAYGIDSSGSPADNIDRTFKEKRELFDSSFGSQKQDSPIKTSPVSERIKALEALAAKQNDFDRSDGGFPHFKERHYEKSPTEPQGISSRLSFQKRTTSNEQESSELPFQKRKMSNEQESPFQKRTMSNEQESPESPFEVLGEERRGSDFEDTADWMRAHLPPAPDFNIEDPDLDEGNHSPMVQESPSKVMKPNKDTAEVPEPFAGVPDQFMDSPIKVPDDISQSKDDENKQSKQESVEEDSEFDLNFLPTAYMWDKQDKADTGIQGYQTFLDNQELPSSPAPPADFQSTSPPPPVSQQMEPSSTQPSNISKESLEPAEIQEVDSSGESDDTVIEETMSIPTVRNNDLDIKTNEEEEVVPTTEKQPILVPIINVIETEEQVLSDDEEPLEVEEEEEEEEEDEKCEILQGDGKRSPEQHDSEIPEQVSVETLCGECKPDHGISSQTNQNCSDAECSPEHKVIEDDYESGIFLQSSPDSGGLHSEDSQELMSRNLVSFEPLKESFLEKDLDKTAEILSDLPPDISSPSNEPSDVETYLDHYASEELALKDQLNSSYFKESKGEKTEISKSSCTQDNQNTNVRESFEHINDDFNETPNECRLDYESLPEPFLSDPSSDISDFETIICQNKITDYSVDPEDQKSAAEIKASIFQEQEELPVQSIDQQPPVQENPPSPFPSFHEEQSSKISEDISGPVANEITEGSVITKSEPRVVPTKDLLDRPDSPETLSDTETFEAECSVTAATDSFVEFMRECLKSQQDEEPEVLSPRQKTIDQNPKSDAPASTQSSPAMIMDLEQERLTISALKQLGSSQEDEDKDIPTMKTALKPDNPPLPTAKPEASETSSSLTQNKYQPDALLPKEVEAIDIWVAEAYHLAEHVLTAILTHLTVNDLVHWRDPKKSGVVFGVSLLLLLSLAAFSVISVVSYLLLALLCVTISFRIYKSVIQAVQKSSEGHPFKALMEKDVTVPPETFRKHVDACLSHVNRVLKQMSRLFLVEDLVDSLKLAVVMWLLTYVGAVFNGITILILADILLFSVPPVYEKNKTQIDRYIDIARTQINTTIAKLQEKLPGAMKRCKAE
ncbi:reticulon-3 isoform X1 [Puntigrus tetrazona]|uniref:reticulon-3 isoform X1 n=1 Tax=Puntigrus tetrazona TaxID=1606681 RepID=UPI001C8A128D|nr:reticulon-3 isoform X1 [Puntigrus tetrazona]